MRPALAALALLLAVSACSSLQDMHAGYHCGADPAEWRHAAAPANAETYRQLARARWSAEDGDYPTGREHWFVGDAGALKYCLVQPIRGSCETLDGTWWDFEQTADGPSTEFANYGVCVL